MISMHIWAAVASEVLRKDFRDAFIEHLAGLALFASLANELPVVHEVIKLLHSLA